jgi:hypothetical protein
MSIRHHRLLDEFALGLFPGPPATQLSAERFREMRELGATFLVNGPDVSATGPLRQTLALAAEHGLDVVVWDPRVRGFVQASDAADDRRLIQEIVSDCADAAACAAYVVCDEPDLGLFPRLAGICRGFAAAAPDRVPLVNLFPSYGTIHQLGTGDFETYLREFVRQVQPPVLSYDHYPIREVAQDTGWHRDLETARRVSLDAGSPLWICLQSEGIRGGLRVPVREEVFWQAGTAMAYGVRGVLWFTYWTPPASPILGNAPGESGPVEHHYGGILDPNGERTPLFESVKQANAFLHRTGAQLKGAVSRAVVRLSPESASAPGASRLPVAIDPVDARLVVGWFESGERSYLLLASDSVSETQTLRVHAATRNVVARAALEADLTPPDTLVLGPGGSVLLELTHPH